MNSLTEFQNKSINVILNFFFIITFGGLCSLSFFYVVPAEDAVMLYEYAKNFATTGLITYGGNEFPIEGATDFLWMVFIAGLKVAGISEFASALILNFLGLLLILSFFKNPLEKVLIGVAFLLTPFLYSSLSGFSTVFFCAAYIISIKLLFEKSKYVYVSLLFLCLIRPDGIVWGAGIVLIRILQVKNSKEFKSEISKLIVGLIVPGLLYFAWRFWYFQELFPLSFLIKSTVPADLIFFHTDSLKSIFVVIFPIFFVIAGLFKRKEEALKVIILLLIPTLFYAAMKLEKNIGNRFLAPMFFAGLYIFSRFYGIRAIAMFVSLSAYLMFNITTSTADSVVSSSQENIYYLAKDLKQIKGRMLITEAGRLTYFSDWFSEDSWGLNTPRFAHKLITLKDVEKGNYDLIVGHCDLNFLKLKQEELNHDGQRLWWNQCKTLVSYIKKSKFNVYLVPFLNDEKSLKTHIKKFLGKPAVVKNFCVRHDIYAIAPSYENREKLIKIINKHGGISYNINLVTNYDQVCYPR